MFAVALVLLVHSGIRVRAVIDRGFLNEAFHFSLGNYLAGLFMAAPNLILPIMVLNVLGAEQAAYYNTRVCDSSALVHDPECDQHVALC